MQVPHRPDRRPGPLPPLGRWRRWGLMIGLGVIGLGGCVATVPAADQEALDPLIWLPPAPLVTMADTPDVAIKTRRVATGPLPKPKPPRFAPESIIQLASGTPDELIGLGPELTVNLLGEPSAQVEEASTRIWRYDGNVCSLQLTLLLNVLTATYQTVFYEVTPSEGVEISREACLSDIMAARQTTGRALR